MLMLQFVGLEAHNIACMCWLIKRCSMPQYANSCSLLLHAVQLAYSKSQIYEQTT